MLLKTEIRRRAQILNRYIAQIDQKIDQKKYKEAIKFLQSNKKTIYNSYLAPYDPNVYFLDSLKAKREKLQNIIQKTKNQIVKKKQKIQSIRMRRGYNIQAQFNNNTDTSAAKKNGTIMKLKMLPIQQEVQLYCHKLLAHNVGIYVTRFSLSLNDIDKIDYETITLSTNFHTIRIQQTEQQAGQQKNATKIDFDDIITYQECYQHILMSWSGQNYIENYMIMSFKNDQEKDKWFKIIKLCKIIQEAKYKKTRLFEPLEVTQNYLSPEIEEDNDKDESSYGNINHLSEQFINKQRVQKNTPINLVLGLNKTAAYQRLRRQSQFTPQMKPHEKNRKGSEDLSIFHHNKSFRTKQLSHFKSQKSFEDNISQSNSFRTKKQEPKNSYFTNPKQTHEHKDHQVSPFNRKMDKIYQQRNNLIQEHTPTPNKNESNGIFLNSSVINWIEEQDQKSRSSFRSKQFQFANQKEEELQNTNKEQQSNLGSREKQKQQIQNESQHISEDPAEIDESPTLPQNLRSKISSESAFKLHPVLTNTEQKTRNGVSISNQEDNQFQDNSEDHEEQDDNEDNNDLSIIVQTNNIGMKNQMSNSPANNNSPVSDNQRENGTDLSNNQDKQSSEHSDKTSQRFHFQDLERGVNVWKCSPDGWNPHKKILRLSKNHKQLHWKDQQNNQVKKIFLHQIQGILYRFYDAGITKHIKKNVQNEKCLTICCQKDKKKVKKLQFYLCDNLNPKELEDFAQNLRAFIEYRNYKI